MKNTFYFILGIIVIAGSIFLFLKQPYHNNLTKNIRINDITIEVETANTDITRERGLSEKKELPEFTGMFFIFGKPDFYTFWMKDMNFPIDIVWIDENFRIIDINKNVSPNSFPQTFSPTYPAQYVLELPAGFTEKYRIEVGAMIQY